MAVEKTEEELRKEIEELNRQKWEITERLRDPRGLRRGGGPPGSTPRNFAANGGSDGRLRGFVRPAERTDAEPAPKRRLSSAVVKIEDGEIIEDADETVKIVRSKDLDAVKKSEDKPSSFSRRDGNSRAAKNDFPSAVLLPRVLPKDEDPSLVKRNKRMLGQLLGTLEKFRKDDVKLSGTEAYMRRSDSLKRAEERAREESEKLRLQERETIAEKRRRDLTLRAEVAAKTEEKKLELLFLRWSEHHKKLGNFIRTKAEPRIYYAVCKPTEEDPAIVEQRKKEIFEEWKAARREELSEYQKQIGEKFLANVENELDRWQNARKARNTNNGNNNKDAMNLQETMDKELETHRLEHGPKTRKIPGGENDEEEDVEDINAGEDDIMMMEDVLDVEENGRRSNEAATKPEEEADGNGDGSPPPAVPDSEV